ncbi:MAG: amidohydrolase [Sporichthyaceae bacterium]|nr:amidohydrolase [Sporichthyaceae bacterium]
MTLTTTLTTELSQRFKAYADELVELRRDLHAHPELARAEVRTTRLIRERLESVGLKCRVFPGGTGLVCEIGSSGRTVALRGDIDALPIQDEKNVPYRSTVDGVSHACGHDVHSTVLLGAGLICADLDREGLLPGRVRLVFQPAEEALSGGALDVIEADGIDEVDVIFALHCDPGTDVGQVGIRSGAITAACDKVCVRLAGPGGHTARPHLTSDLVYALSKIATDLPAALSRRVDPRHGLSLVWGRIVAGTAPNVIPQAGELEGTLRCLELAAWEEAPELISQLIEDLATSYVAKVEIDYQRGVPPVVNNSRCVDWIEQAAVEELGVGAVVLAEQSLGGEDFAWYLRDVRGALARLGVRTPGDPIRRDLHQGRFDVDERAIGIGVRVTVATALRALVSLG